MEGHVLKSPPQEGEIRHFNLVLAELHFLQMCSLFKKSMVYTFYGCVHITPVQLRTVLTIDGLDASVYAPFWCCYNRCV